MTTPRPATSSRNAAGKGVQVLAPIAGRDRQTHQPELVDRPGCFGHVFRPAPRRDGREAGETPAVIAGERGNEVVVPSGVVDVPEVEVAVPDVRVGDDRDVDVSAVHSLELTRDVEHVGRHSAEWLPIGREEVDVGVDDHGDLLGASSAARLNARSTRLIAA